METILCSISFGYKSSEILYCLGIMSVRMVIGFGDCVPLTLMSIAIYGSE